MMRRTALPLAAAALIWACASTPQLLSPAAASEPLPLDQRGARMEFHLAKCAEILDFDFNSVIGLGEHELAPGEGDWRDCAYVGIKKFMIPNTTVPQLYQLLIVEDKAMTQLLLQGNITRMQRAKRIRALVGTIETFEVTNLMTVSPDLTPEQMKGVAAVVRGSVASMRYLALAPEPI